MTDSRRLRVVLMVAGFPTADRPDNGIFNFRSARDLATVVDLKVLFLRAWRPGRKRISDAVFNGLPVVTVAVPQFPRATNLNLRAYSLIGWPLVKPHLKGVDILHSVDVTTMGVIGGAWARKAGAKHVTQAIGTDVNWILPRIAQSRLMRKWADRVDGAVCNSDALRAELAAVYPKLAITRVVRTVYRGTALERYTPDGEARGPLASRNPVRFAFFGGFAPYANLPWKRNRKGGETLLAAWREAEETLHANGGSLMLAGPDCDCDVVREWYASLAHPEIVAIAGNIRPEDVASYLRASDVVLIPSMEDGLPNAGVEAAASGRAIFGSNIGGLPEIIEDGRTGLLLPAGDAHALAAALVDYSARVEDLRAMGAAARRRAIERFDHNLYAPRMLQLYKDVLEGGTN